jgi:hypothetical protein
VRVKIPERSPRGPVNDRHRVQGPAVGSPRTTRKGTAMQAFLDLQRAMSDWLAIVRPEALHGSLSVGFAEIVHGATIPFRASSARPTDPVDTRRRCIAAVREFLAAVYPDADYCAISPTDLGIWTDMLFFRDVNSPALSIEESRRAADFNTTDEYPVHLDGTLGKRLTRREDPENARSMRRSARRYRQRQSEAAE